MSIPFFFPPPTYAVIQPNGPTMTVRELCELAGARCKASGDWTSRLVEIHRGEALAIEAAPGGWGLVRITLPFECVKERSAARLALAAMAFAVMDPVCRQSIAGLAWAKPSAPLGRPKSATAMTTAERQRKFREKARKS